VLKILLLAVVASGLRGELLAMRDWAAGRAKIFCKQTEDVTDMRPITSVTILTIAAKAAAKGGSGLYIRAG
jgi:hypothetical protein